VWRRQAIVAAGERYRRSHAADPEHVRDYSRRYRERLREHALTISQLRERSVVHHSDVDRATLRRVMREEIRIGHVEQGRYFRLNGSLPPDVVEALRRIAWRSTPRPLSTTIRIRDDALRQESHVENLVDEVVNLIASSGLDELAVVRRVAQRYGYDLRPVAAELE
jgi:hypothetical protein